MSEKPAGSLVQYTGETTPQCRSGELFVIVAYHKEDACLGRWNPAKGWTKENLMNNLVTHLHVALCYLHLFEVRE
jgi:hypothetical protein